MISKYLSLRQKEIHCIYFHLFSKLLKNTSQGNVIFVSVTQLNFLTTYILSS